MRDEGLVGDGEAGGKTAEMVMACFRQHGLEGNAVIRLPPEHAAGAER
jgi:hypothetical protein